MNPHPRIWMSPAILATLKARAARNTSRWQVLKDLVDRPGQDWDIGIANYSVAYIVTGDPIYAEKSWALMDQSMGAATAQVSAPDPTVTPDPTGTGEVSPDSGYACRSYFPAASVCRDYLDPWLSPAQKAKLEADLRTCAAWVWPETNPSRAGAWAVDNPGNNYWYGFLTTWLAGLTLGDDAIINLALSKWTTMASPYLAGPAAGGCMYEGTSYSTDSLSLMMFSTYAHATATGTAYGVPWQNQALQMLAHQTTPEMDALMPWGDQTKDQGGGLVDAGRLPFLLGAAQGVPWARTWLDNAVPNVMLQRRNAWAEFLWYPEETAGTDYRKTWPVFAAAQGAGIVATRSSWQPGAVQCVISAGPTRESHQDRASGAAGLHAGGDWLLSWAKVTSHSGIAQETQDSLCLTIDAKRQAWTQDKVTQDRIEDNATYTALRADLTAAYEGQCSRYTREYLFLKTGTLFVRDVLDGVAAGANVVSHSHAGRLLPTVDAIGYTARGAAAQLFALAVVPDVPRFQIVTLTQDRDPGVVGYRLDLDDGGGRQFLIVYEAAPLTQAGSTWRDWDVTQFVGALSPNYLVGWPKGPGPWSYIAPGALKHLIMGLEPGKAYTVPGGTATATVGGVLMYDGPPAGTRVTIQVADGGGGSDLTNRTFNIVSGTLIPASGPPITLTGGQLVVTAIPGAIGPEAAEPPPGKGP
jgi:hypothetical protein